MTTFYTQSIHAQAHNPKFFKGHPDNVSTRYNQVTAISLHSWSCSLTYINGYILRLQIVNDYIEVTAFLSASWRSRYGVSLVWFPGSRGLPVVGVLSPWPPRYTVQFTESVRWSCLSLKWSHSSHRNPSFFPSSQLLNPVRTLAPVLRSMRSCKEKPAYHD